jgi:putative membrane protein
MLMTPEDHEKIRAAIDAAEARTSGEICGVLAHECSQYWEVPLAWAAGVSLAAPAVALALGFRPEALLSPSLSSWTVAEASAAASQSSFALIAYALVQLVIFVAVALIVSIPPVRRLLTPKALKRERTHRRAREMFAARGLHLEGEETGVLIFASISERMAEVVADHRIAAKVSPEVWSDVVEALTSGMKAGNPGSGFAAAIAKAGDHLALHFPRRPDDVNRLPDTVIELDS